jgi:hypothetical protein
MREEPRGSAGVTGTANERGRRAFPWGRSCHSGRVDSFRRRIYRVPTADLLTLHNDADPFKASNLGFARDGIFLKEASPVSERESRRPSG